MRTIVLLLFVAVSLILHGCTSPTNDFNLQESADANPWTHLSANNNPDNFQFAIMSDRTGGNRPGIFAGAIEKVNLLQPEFVMCVGDLIEGYTEDAATIDSQWDQIDSIVSKLDMPFFYLPGNHDITTPAMADNWAKRHGRTYYHFVYKDVLFLCLNTDDPYQTDTSGSMTDTQVEYARQTLAANPDVRWTFVFMHKPMWTMKFFSPFSKIEEMLTDRQYTVIAGHTHKYMKTTRQHHNYYILSTTGGFNDLNGLQHGQFDHIVWVTMKDNTPIISNLMLDGIHNDNPVELKD